MVPQAPLKASQGLPFPPALRSTLLQAEEAKLHGQALAGSDAKKLGDFLLEHLWKMNSFFFPPCVPIYSC